MKQIVLNFNNKRNINYTSYFNYKLFKRFLIMKILLSLKLSKLKSTFYLNLLGIKKGVKINENPFKIYYTRNEFIPFRILRFFYYMLSLNKNFISKLIPVKLSIYNGKEDKIIDINKGTLSKLIKCKFKFGSFIFTRALYIFRKKKKKKRK